METCIKCHLPELVVKDRGKIIEFMTVNGEWLRWLICVAQSHAHRAEPREPTREPTRTPSPKARCISPHDKLRREMEIVKITPMIKKAIVDGSGTALTPTPKELL